MTLEVNSPSKKNPLMHVVHKMYEECTSRGWHVMNDCFKNEPLFLLYQCSANT